MDLLRLHAYSVFPQRLQEEPTPPIGGAIRPSPELKSVMDENAASSKLWEQPLVDFLVDPANRTNLVRDAIMEFAFGAPASAKAAAIRLAKRLGESMDRRSAPCLFIPTVHQEDGHARIVLWVFPREHAFQLRMTAETPSIDILTDVFSQTSRLRKAGAFQGKNLRTDFLTGHVLDYQANSSTRDIADFWIGRFLECTLALKDEAGTRVLARTLRRVYETCARAEGKEQLQAAIMAMRRSPHRRISLATFADRYLDGEAKDAFLAIAPEAPTRAALFDFDLATFDSVLQFRVFQLHTGVYVSSPPSQIGESVRITGDRERTLSCEGTIVDEKMRTRHG